MPPPKNGSICRIVDFAPIKGELPHGVDHHAILQQMGIDPATQGYQRHIYTHRTRSIDYAIVMDGEIDMLLDDTEVHCKAGDVLVQQGTNHAWVNKSGKPCRICFVLIDSRRSAGVEEGLEAEEVASAAHLATSWPGLTRRSSSSRTAGCPGQARRMTADVRGMR